MRTAVMAALAATMLTGCASTLEGAWDEAARDECERNTDARERGGCLDRVDQNRRERGREDD